MRKIFIIIAIIIIGVQAFGLSPVVRNRLVDYMCALNSHLPRARAEMLVDTSDTYSTIFGISPIVVLAIIWQETGFRNLYGDHGEAVGYGQLHEATLDYLKMYYPSLLNINYKRLIQLPDTQVELIYMYLRVLLDTTAHGEILKAIAQYNGSTIYDNYVKSVYSKIKILERLCQ